MRSRNWRRRNELKPPGENINLIIRKGLVRKICDKSLVFCPGIGGYWSFEGLTSYGAFMIIHFEFPFAALRVRERHNSIRFNSAFIYSFILKYMFSQTSFWSQAGKVLNSFPRKFKLMFGSTKQTMYPQEISLHKYSACLYMELKKTCN